MEFLHKYETVEDWNDAYNGDEYIEPWVSYTVEGGGVKYNKFENWARAIYAPDTCAGSGYRVMLDEVGDTFDNSENSVYYLYDECNEIERTYRGVKIFWDHHCNLMINELYPLEYYDFDYSGGEWRIIRFFQPAT